MQSQRSSGGPSRSAAGTGAPIPITSIGGVAGVQCRQHVASIAYWSPAVGFQASRVRTGGRVVAVTFTGDRHESQITAKCRNGDPVGVVEERSLGRAASVTTSVSTAQPVTRSPAAGSVTPAVRVTPNGR
jgi:hypothetical protein